MLIEEEDEGGWGAGGAAEETKRSEKFHLKVANETIIK